MSSKSSNVSRVDVDHASPRLARTSDHAPVDAVTDGQAALYRRATRARAEILRILDGLTPLTVDGDVDGDVDVEVEVDNVRNAVQSLVDEMGAPGGPRIDLLNAYFAELTGADHVQSSVTIGGQLGALRDRFGLGDEDVNTIEEEGLRSAHQTLVDLVRDLNEAWPTQRPDVGGEDCGPRER